MDEPRQEEPSSEIELRVFIARKLGDLHADLAKLLALIEYLLPLHIDQRAVRNQRLLYLVIGMLLLNYLLLSLHIAITSGWL